MTAAPVIQAERPDPGAHVSHFDVPQEARQMATSLLTDAQRVSRAQDRCATLAELESAEATAGRAIQGWQALRNNLKRQITAARAKAAQ